MPRNYDRALRMLARMLRDARNLEESTGTRREQQRELERRLAFWQRRPFD